MQLDHVGPIVLAPAGMEPVPARPLVVVENRLNLGNRFIIEMRQLQVERPLAFVRHFPHIHNELAAPIVAACHPLALAVGGIAAERTCDVRTCGTVIVLHGRVNLVALNTCQLDACMVRHCVALARIRRILIGAVQIAGVG
ncbi:hypothetical protein D3C84_608650 [compost metagenome]